MDEFHNHHMNDDVIRERLRSIKCIPGVSYQVYGDNVFVFEKLVQLVKQNGHNLARVLPRSAGSSLLPQEAIQEWLVCLPGAIFSVRSIIPTIVRRSRPPLFQCVFAPEIS